MAMKVAEGAAAASEEAAVAEASGEVSVALERCTRQPAQIAGKSAKFPSSQ